MSIPVLLKPGLYAMHNRWRQGLSNSKAMRRDISLGLLSLFIMSFLYLGMSSVLHSIKQAEAVIPIHPSMILQIFFLFLLGILLLSSSVSAVGVLFTSKDTDLLLSSPLSPPQLFLGKFIKILQSSSWMILVFGLPILLAFGFSYQVGINFYIKALIVVLPFIAIPATVSLCLIILICSFVPARFTRHALLVLGSITLFVVYYSLNQTEVSSANFNQSETVLALFAKLSIVNQDWLPSYWLAHFIGSLLKPVSITTLPHILLLACVFISLTSLSYLIFNNYYISSYSRALSNSRNIHLASKSSQKRIQILLPWVNTQTRSLLCKELKLFSRDITQTVQLMLLIGICIMYLYNFKILAPASSLPESLDLWRKGILMLFNLVMGSFVIIAICTRFVFPSISLEGKSFWLIATGPLDFNRFLSTKFWIWYVPIASISSVIFVTGAMAIHVPPIMIIFHELMCLFLSYGMVGVAIGCGALFHQFDWEHQAQLSTSLGSLAYMLIASAIVVVTMLPIGLLLLFRILRITTETPVSLAWYSLVCICLLLTAYLNILAKRWCFKLGVKSLETKKLAG